MRVLVWLFRALIFFILFAFALNNQESATVRWFFGAQWQAPMVMIVLLSFVGGCFAGALAMLPSWWRQRRELQRLGAAPAADPAAARSGPVSVLPSGFGPESPLRERA
jgi:putative membrane protein